MDNLAYLDELDRELAEYNREKTEAKLKPAERDGGFETARYGFQMEALEQGVTRLSTFAEAFEKDIVAIDARRNRDLLGLIGNIFAFVVCGALAIVFAFLALKMGIGGVISFFFCCANIHNLFDKYYYRSGMNTNVVPQKGRWFMFDIAYKF